MNEAEFEENVADCRATRNYDRMSHRIFDKKCNPIDYLIMIIGAVLEIFGLA